MARRELPALRLREDPLFLVLAQVRIAPVLEMERFIPPIQERLRRSGFPLYNEVVTQEVTVKFPQHLSSEQRTSWAFMDERETRAVVLTPNSIVLETSDYEVFDAFMEQAESALTVVGQATDISLADRIGLRYVNRIEPTDNLDLKDMVHTGLLAVTEEMLDVRSMVSRFEWRCLTDTGRLAIRLTKVDDQSVLPTDLENTLLKIRKPTPGVVALVLDTDHFMEGKWAYNVPHLIESLWNLHRHTDRTFREIVTEQARRAWGAEEV